jgi:hypothetical protein
MESIFDYYGPIVSVISSRKVILIRIGSICLKAQRHTSVQTQRPDNLLTTDGRSPCGGWVASPDHQGIIINKFFEREPMRRHHPPFDFF